MEAFPEKTRTALISSFIGNALDTYDFAMFAVLTQTIAHTFFNSADGFNNILATYACFAYGFIARPIGGIFFGYLGDQYGRKKSLITSIELIVIPPVLLGLLPGYHILGYISMVGVLFSRFLQGVSNGGECITNAIYLTELAKTRKQVPLLSSFTPIGGVSGVGLRLVFAHTLRVYLGEQAFNDYGWRIPFLTSTLLAAYAMYLRKELPETHINPQAETQTLVTLFNKHQKSIVQSFLSLCMHVRCFGLC